MEVSVNWLTILLFAILASSQVLPDPITLFDQANNAYLKKDYHGAVELYEELLNNNVKDANVYFNLGNAYFELGDLGRALLNYRRSQQLLPHDVELAEKLNLVRAKRIDLQGDETDFIVGLASVTNDWFTLRDLNLAICLLGSFLALLISLLFVRPALRKRLITFVIMCGVVFAFGVLSLVSRIVVNSVRPSAVVIASVGVVMSGPGEQYLELFRIHSASEVRLVDEKNGWARFRLPDGRGGWILQTDIEKLDP